MSFSLPKKYTKVNTTSEIPSDFNGWIFVKDSNNLLHYINGAISNNNGPSVVNINKETGSVEFCSHVYDKKYHNLRGPCVYSSHKQNHSISFYINEESFSVENYWKFTGAPLVVHNETQIPSDYTGVVYIDNWKAHVTIDNGKVHNDFGPAIYYDSGSLEWWRENKRHRLDGPAVVYADKKNSQYFVNGVPCIKERYQEGVNSFLKTHPKPFQETNEEVDTTKKDVDALLNRLSQTLNELPLSKENGTDKVHVTFMPYVSANNIKFTLQPSTTTDSIQITNILQKASGRESMSNTVKPTFEMTKVKTIADWVEQAKKINSFEEESKLPVKAKSFVLNYDNQSNKFQMALAALLADYHNEIIVDNELTAEMFQHALSYEGFEVCVTVDEDDDVSLRVPGVYDQIFTFDVDDEMEELFAVPCNGMNHAGEYKLSNTTKGQNNKKFQGKIFNFLFQKFLPEKFHTEENLKTFQSINDDCKPTTDGDIDFAFNFLGSDNQFALKVVDKDKFISWAKDKISYDIDDRGEDEISDNDLTKEIENYLKLTDNNIIIRLNENDWDGDSEDVLEMNYPVVNDEFAGYSFKLTELNSFCKAVDSTMFDPEKIKVNYNNKQFSLNEVVNKLSAGSHSAQTEKPEEISKTAATKQAANRTGSGSAKASSSNENEWITEELKKELANGLVRAGTSEFVDVLKQGLKKTLVSDLNLPGGMMTQMMINAGLDTKVGDGLLSMAVAASMPLIEKVIKEEHKQYTELLGRELRVRSYERFIQPIIHMIREPVHDFIQSKLTGQSFDIEKYRTVEYPKQVVANKLEAPKPVVVPTKKATTTNKKVVPVEVLVQEQVVLTESTTQTS